MMSNADYRKMKEQTEQVASYFPGAEVTDWGQKHAILFYVPIIAKKPLCALETCNDYDCESWAIQNSGALEAYYDYDCGLWEVQNASGTWSALEGISTNEDEKSLSTDHKDIAEWIEYMINQKYGEFSTSDIYV